MKQFILLAAMLCAPAYATNVLYSPVPDPITNAPSIMYLTDTHSRGCVGTWFKADIVNSASNKSSLTVDMCWTYSLENGFSVWIPSTNLAYNNMEDFAIVPGAEIFYRTFVKILNSEIQKKTNAFNNALRNANPHP